MIRLAPPDPGWPVLAAEEISRSAAALPHGQMHHIGSTAVPGLPAKPIIDLLAVLPDAAALDAAKAAVLALGYDRLEPNGLAGRRCARQSAPLTGRRQFHAHCYPSGHPAIRRHLAFRDLLRDDPQRRDAYARVKRDCAGRNPDDRTAHKACKDRWSAVAETEVQA